MYAVEAVAAVIAVAIGEFLGLVADANSADRRWVSRNQELLRCVFSRKLNLRNYFKNACFKCISPRTLDFYQHIFTFSVQCKREMRIYILQRLSKTIFETSTFVCRICTIVYSFQNRIWSLSGLSWINFQNTCFVSLKQNTVKLTSLPTIGANPRSIIWW